MPPRKGGPWEFLAIGRFWYRAEMGSIHSQFTRLANPLYGDDKTIQYQRNQEEIKLAKYFQMTNRIAMALL